MSLLMESRTREIAEARARLRAAADALAEMREMRRLPPDWRERVERCREAFRGVLGAQVTCPRRPRPISESGVGALSRSALGQRER
jgi:hypothetical protein